MQVSDTPRDAIGVRMVLPGESDTWADVNAGARHLGSEGARPQKRKICKAAVATVGALEHV
ncbi:hypothetical protein BPNSA17_16690 [Bordetella petrii]